MPGTAVRPQFGTRPRGANLGAWHRRSATASAVTRCLAPAVRDTSVKNEPRCLAPPFAQDLPRCTDGDENGADAGGGNRQTTRGKSRCVGVVGRPGWPTAHASHGTPGSRLDRSPGSRAVRTHRGTRRDVRPPRIRTVERASRTGLSSRWPTMRSRSPTPRLGSFQRVRCEWGRPTCTGRRASCARAHAMRSDSPSARRRRTWWIPMT